VARLIRNLPASRAVATLTFSKRRIAHQVKKTLESAIANAENNHQLDVDRLVVTRADVGRSTVMKRFHARGRGRAARVEKWFSHLTIVVSERAQTLPGGEERVRRTSPVAERPTASAVLDQISDEGIGEQTAGAPEVQAEAEHVEPKSAEADNKPADSKPAGEAV
jgi:large subunit ribosomal protein L22